MSEQTTCAPSTASVLQSRGHCLWISRSRGRCPQDDAARSMLASELHDQERCTKPLGARWLRRYVPNLSPSPEAAVGKGGPAITDARRHLQPRGAAGPRAALRSRERTASPALRVHDQTPQPVPTPSLRRPERCSAPDQGYG